MPSPQELLRSVREQRPSLDHLVRAASRYTADTGDRLAAAVTFFGFLSFFPLLAVSASLLTLVVGDSAVTTVAQQVDEFSPGLAEQLELEELLRDNRKVGLTGLVGLAGLLYAGLGWVDALREAVRTVWHQNVKAGSFLRKKALDVLVLAGLGITLGFSLLVSAAAGTFTDVALRLVGLQDSPVAGVLVTVLGTVLALVTSTLLFLYLFIRLPKVQTPWRRVLKGAVLAAVLFEVLKRAGAVYIERTTENPLYGSFAVVVGLLIWINLVSRMLLFCAAWTVTAPYDSDVQPSGTADAEQARKAGIPVEFADDDPDDPPTVEANGAPTPLTAALQGTTPPQDEPEGPPSRQESVAVASRRAAAGDHPASGREPVPEPDARPGPARRRQELPGEAATRRAAQAGAALVGAGVAGVGLYAVRTVAGVLRR